MRARWSLPPPGSMEQTYLTECHVLHYTLLPLPTPKLPDATPAGAVASETLLTIITALAAFLLGAASLQVLPIPALRAGVGTTAPDVDRQRGRSLLGAAPAAAEAREHASVHHAVAAAAHAGLAVEDVEPAGRAAGRHAQLAVRRRLLLLLLERRQGWVRVHHRRPRAHHRLRAHHLHRLRRHVPRPRSHHQVRRVLHGTNTFQVCNETLVSRVD
jgi:hypothetical protein